MTEQTEQTQSEEKKQAGRKGFGISFKVSAKGAVSVYGLGRFPVTLYREQWMRLLERTGDLKAFIDEHADELTKKGEAVPASTPEPVPSAETAPAVAETAKTVEEAGAPVDGDGDGGDDDPDLPPDDYDGLR